MEFFIFSKFKFFKFHWQRRALQLVFYILDADLPEELKISLLRLVTRMVLLFSSGVNHRQKNKDDFIIFFRLNLLDWMENFLPMFLLKTFLFFSWQLQNQVKQNK